MVQRDPRPHGHEYDEWPVADDRFDRVRYIGPLADGVPVFYHVDSETVFGADVDEENRRIVPRDDGSFDPEESLADALERLGDEIGWESLTEFAEEHLEDDGEDDG